MHVNGVTASPQADRTFFVINALLSTGAIAFIAFILLRDVSPQGEDRLAFLPAVNATMNALSSICLAAGWIAIRRRALHVHRLLMVSAFAFSAVFLVGYLVYHSVHGDTHFTGTGLERSAYLTMLASHIVLSIAVVPGALTSFYFAYTRSFTRHRRLNRVFLPIWLYVSVTGVIIYFWLR
jgi:putative membrane protein